VNRLSFGIQSFDDAMLKRLGRIHDSGEAERAVKMAQDAGYDNFNIDLMYALPEQTLAGAEADLERAFALQPAHISHYQLTLEPNTVFFARPPQGIPDEDNAWDMQEHCQALLAQAGFGQYEVSAYARPGRQSAHNLNYWRFGDYLGIGAGAHGKISSGAEDRAAPLEAEAPAGLPGQRRHAGLVRRRRCDRASACRSSTCSTCCACTKVSACAISSRAPGCRAACWTLRWPRPCSAAGWT
jgi:putative oxygen-independent coproporphyrinogen III oxidase